MTSVATAPARPAAESKAAPAAAQPLRFLGKRVIVTGASAGIGKATAIAFGKQGATVALIARRKPLLESTIADQLGGKGFAISADFYKLDQVTAAIKEAARLLGGVDVLVNNVGGGEVSWLALPYSEQLSKYMSFNLDTAEYATEAALPFLLESKGSIVNIGSIAGTHPVLGFAAYSVAKAALHHSSKVRATVLARKGVNVNVVAPAAVNTDILIPYKAAGVDPEAFFKIATERQLDGQPISADHVAEAVLFLSDKSASARITATVLHVDGGAHADVVFNVPTDRADFRRDY